VRIPFLLTVLAMASLVDAREHRVPNAIPAALLLAALVLGAADGPAAFGQALAGALFGSGVLLPFYALGGMGAGDVKLMGGAGAMLGWKLGVAAAGLALVAGALIAVAYAIARSVHERGDAPLAASLAPVVVRARYGRARFPFAIAVLLGTALALLASQAGRGAV
jgi:prepilin peptidase CpaA